MRRVTGTIRIRGGDGGVALVLVPNVTARTQRQPHQSTLLSRLPQRALSTMLNHNSPPPPSTTTRTTRNPTSQNQMQPRSSAKKNRMHRPTVSYTNNAPTPTTPTMTTRWMVGLYSWRHYLFASSSMRTTRSSLDRVGATCTSFDAASLPPPRVEFTTFDTESQAHEWYQAHDHCSRILWQQQQPQQSNDCQHTTSDHSPPPPQQDDNDNTVNKARCLHPRDHNSVSRCSGCSVWDHFASSHTLVACSTAFWDVQGLGVATLWLGPPPPAVTGKQQGTTATTPTTTTTTTGATPNHDYPAVSRQAIVQALQQGLVPFVPPQRTPSVQWSVKWSLQAVTATIRAASRSSKMNSNTKQQKDRFPSLLPTSTGQSRCSPLSWPFRNKILKNSRLAGMAAWNGNATTATSNNDNNHDEFPSLSSSSSLLSNHHRRAMAHFGTAPHRNASLCYFPVDTFPHVRGHVALTLDDAPCRFHSPNPTTAVSASLVPAVRSLLHQYQAQATFMVVGHWVRRSTDHQSSLIDLIQDGHELANHGMLDQSYEFASPHEFGQAVHECQDILESLYDEAAAGVVTSADHYSSVPRLRWFRPPHGRYTQAMETVLDEQGLLPVLCDAYASCPIVQDGPFVAQQLLHQVQDGSILLLHMPERHVRPWCWTALQLVLQHLKHHNWRVVTLSHLAHLASLSVPEQAPPQQAATNEDEWNETTWRRTNKPVWWQVHPQFQPALKRKQPSTPNDPVPFSAPSLPLLVSSPKIWNEWKTRSLDLSSLMFRRKNQQEEGP